MPRHRHTRHRGGVGRKIGDYRAAVSGVARGGGWTRRHSPLTLLPLETPHPLRCGLLGGYDIGPRSDVGFLFRRLDPVASTAKTH